MKRSSGSGTLFVLIPALVPVLSACTSVRDAEPAADATGTSVQAINNGDLDLANRFPGVGFVGRLNANGGIVAGCTGTLVTPRHVLTAAHCAIGNETANFVFVPSIYAWNPASGIVPGATTYTHTFRREANNRVLVPGYFAREGITTVDSDFSASSSRTARDVALFDLDTPIVPATIPFHPISGVAGNAACSWDEDGTGTNVGYGATVESPLQNVADNRGNRSYAVSEDWRDSTEGGCSDDCAARYINDFHPAGSRIGETNGGDSGGPLFSGDLSGGASYPPTVCGVDSSSNVQPYPVDIFVPFRYGCGSIAAREIDVLSGG